MAYLQHLCVLTCIALLAASGLRLLIVDARLIFAGQALFVAVGAYAFAIANTALGWGYFGSFCAAIGAGVLAGAIVVAFLNRLRDDSIVLGSIALMLLFSACVRNFESLTGGARGVSGIRSVQSLVSMAGRDLTFPIVLATVTLLSLWAVERLRSRRLGTLLRAQQDDDVLLASFGHVASRVRASGLLVAASSGAISGAFFAQYFGFIDPTAFSLNESITFLVVAAVAGRGGVLSLVIGAFVAILAPELFRLLGADVAAAAQLRLFFFGLLLASWSRISRFIARLVSN